MTAAPNRLIHSPTEHGGLGVTSLLTAYTTSTTQHMVLALNDEGMLGKVTHALLLHQYKVTGNTPSNIHKDLARQCSQIRKLAHILSVPNIRLIKAMQTTLPNSKLTITNIMDKVLQHGLATTRNHSLHEYSPRSNSWESPTYRTLHITQSTHYLVHRNTIRTLQG